MRKLPVPMPPTFQEAMKATDTTALWIALYWCDLDDCAVWHDGRVGGLVPSEAFDLFRYHPNVWAWTCQYHLGALWERARDWLLCDLHRGELYIFNCKIAWKILLRQWEPSPVPRTQPGVKLHRVSSDGIAISPTFPLAYFPRQPGRCRDAVAALREMERFLDSLFPVA